MAERYFPALLYTEWFRSPYIFAWQKTCKDFWLAWYKKYRLARHVSKTHFDFHCTKLYNRYFEWYKAKKQTTWVNEFVSQWPSEWRTIRFVKGLHFLKSILFRKCSNPHWCEERSYIIVVSDVQGRDKHNFK